MISAALYTFILTPPLDDGVNVFQMSPKESTFIDAVEDVAKMSPPDQTELIVIVTALIGSGSELLTTIFQNTKNWNYFQKSSNDSNFKIYGTFDRKASWEEYQEEPKFVKSLVKNMINGSSKISFLQENLTNELTVLNNNLGSWNSKHPFLSNKMDQKSIFIHFVRDPRSWINAMLWRTKFDKTEKEKIMSLLVDNHLQKHGNTKEGNLFDIFGNKDILGPFLSY